MSQLATPPTLIDADTFLTLPESRGYELVNGHLLEKGMGAESSEIGMNLGVALSLHLRDAGIKGHVYGSDCGYTCFPQQKGKVRKPDVSYVAADRLVKTPTGWIPIAPDFAVEVVSPHDIYLDIEGRMTDFINAGTPVFWIIDPLNQHVRVHRGNGTFAYLTSDDPIPADPALPDFRPTLRDLTG